METLTIFFVWLLLAAFGYFLTAPFFRSLPDKGLGFAPWIGLFAIAFPSWWLGHTGFYQLSTYSTWGLCLLLTGAMTFAIKKSWIKLESYQVNPTYVLFHVTTWVSLYTAYIWFFRHNPAIADIEKLPDLSMLVTAYRAEILPPLNVFASDQVINYYYFGFYKAATLAHLTGVEPHQIFNPMKALLLATASSSLASATMLILDRLLELKDQVMKLGLCILGGVLSFALAFFIGNFHTMYHWVILAEAKFWYPDATRYIANTIHEFPLYSFIIGDLHAHLIALPTAGLTLALVFLYGEKLSQYSGSKIQHILKNTWKNLIPLFLVYGLSYASNSWDIFTGLLLVGFLTWFILKQKSLFSFWTLLNTGALSVIYVLGAVVSFLPFWILFEPLSSGLGHTPSSQSSPTIQLMVIWLIHASFPLLYLCLENRKEYVYRYIRVVCALGFGLILFMEYFYFKDIYSGHLRANTLFKIGIQIWIWFSVISACYFVYILGNRPQKSQVLRIAATLILALLLGSGFLYTKKAVKQYIEVNRSKSSQVDGIDFLRIQDPEDYKVIQWLKSNESRQSVVLTVVGESFSKDGAINAFTGNPTVLTWTTHNWLWHGSQHMPMKPVSKMTKRLGLTDTINDRVALVKDFYQSTNPQKAKEFIERFRVKYVVVSNRERAKYPKLNEAIIKSLGEVALQGRSITLYKMSDYGPE